MLDYSQTELLRRRNEDLSLRMMANEGTENTGIVGGKLYLQGRKEILSMRKMFLEQGM